MRTRTRFTQRIALVAVLALVLALAPAVGGRGAASAASDSPGQSNHCPAGTEQVRFEGAGSKEGFTVTEVSGKVWTWVYDGDQLVSAIYVFGGKALTQVPGADGTTSGTVDATALDLRNPGGQIADISHVDFCLVPPEPTTTTTEPTTSTTEPTTSTTEPTTSTTEPTTTTTEDEGVEGIEETTSTTEAEGVKGEGVEETTTTAAAEVAGEVAEALPRTGVGSAATALVAVASLLIGTGLLAAVRRRQLVV